MKDFSAELNELKETIKQKNPPKEGIVFYGSSSFRLWENLEQNLGMKNIANLAFGGSTLEACVHHFEEIILPFQPKSFVFYGGDNDIGNGKSAEDVLAYFEALHTKVRTHFPEIPFTFLSIKPSPCRGMLLPQVRAANEMIYLKTKTLENTSYIDIHSDMLIHESEINCDLFIEDELHLNQKGYDLWTNKMLEHRKFWDR